MTKPTPPASIASKLASAAALNFFGMILLRLMGLINIVILARLLTPDDFGLMALAVLAVGFTEALINKQFESALIRQPDVEAAHFDTAFGLSVMIGAAGAVMIFGVSGAMARFFDVQDLEFVLRWLSFVPLLMGLRNPYFVTFEKDLNFYPRLWLNLSSRLVMTVVSVLTALVLGSYWALVIALLVMHAVYCAITWVWAPGRPTFGFRHWKDFARFGVWLTLAGLAIFAQRRFPLALLGRGSGVFDTGLFQVSSEISTTMTHQMMNPIGRGLFPGLMSVSNNPDKLRRAYLLGQQSLLGIALPLGVGVAVAAAEVVRVLLGTQWEAAVPVIAVLTPVAAISTLTIGVNAVKMIAGDTRSLFVRNLMVLAILIPVTIVGYTGFGILGLAVSQAFALLIGLLLTLSIAAQATKTRVIDPLLISGRSFIAVAFMTLVLIGFDLAFPMDPFEVPVLEAAVRLVTQIGLAAGSVACVHFVLWRGAGRPDGFERQLINLISRVLERFGKTRAVR